jgi:hypothetical protein
MARATHLPDERLFDCYLAERAGESADLPASEHLIDCETCAARYAELAGFMESIRKEGAADADAVFTPERLRSQQEQIAKRIEHVGRAARVLSFPGRVGREMAGTTRVAPRWLAAAAAAGLFVGVAVGGTLFDSGFHVRGLYVATPSEEGVLARSKPQRRVAAPPPVRVTSPASVKDPEPVAAVPVSTNDDDRFLLELENALQYPRTGELMPFDALTPHVRDISNQLR